MSGPWIIQRSTVLPDYCQIIVHNAEEAARATEEHSGWRGRDQGVGRFDRLELKAIADAVHKHSVTVHAHLYEEEAVKDAFRAGIDVWQHVGSAGTPPLQRGDD